MPTKSLDRLYLTALASFLFSGCTGLIYEVLWTRRLTLIFGHSILAISTVVTAFMGGLALGSYRGGRLADRISQSNRIARQCLRYYGILEIFVGFWALLTVPLLDVVESIYIRLSHTMGVGHPLYLACFVLSSLVLLIPTSAMGATVPVLSRLFILHRNQLGGRLSWLYGINTLGAVMGAGLAGFVLFPLMGLLRSIFLCAAVNLTIGATCVVVASRSQLGLIPEPRLEDTLGEPSTLGGGPGRSRLMISFAVGGVASMSFQVAWTRALILSLGSSVYAFSTILLVFLCGLALGSLAYGRLAARRQPTFGWLAAVYLWIGCAGALSIQALGYLPLALRQLYPYTAGTYLGFLLLGGGMSALILLPPTFGMGLTFPLVTQLYSRHIERLGRDIGGLYSANTLGCILGSFVSGFLLLPTVGLQRTLELAVALSCAGSQLALLGDRSARRPVLRGLCAAALVGVWWLPAWDRDLVSSGLGYQAMYRGRTMADLRSTVIRPPAYYKDGLSCTVSLCLDGSENMALLVNGKVDASASRLDMMNMKITGFLPSLYHKHPRKAALIGLGGGFTLQAVTRDRRLETIDCVELEQAVVDAAEYFRGFNGDALHQPRVRVQVRDGRTYFLGTPPGFDIIISQPSNPWIAGIGNLFTTDFYKVCRDRLKSEGVFCQWCNTYALSLDDLKMVFHGFFSVFPYGQVWQASHGDLVLVGSPSPLTFDEAQLERMWTEQPEFRDDLVGIGLYEPRQLLGHFVCSREVALAGSGDGPFNTDDLPLLEFSAPKSLYGIHALEENISWIQQLRSQGAPRGPQGLVELGFAWLNLGDRQALGAVLPQLPDSPERAYISASLENDPEKHRKEVESALLRFPDDFRLAYLGAVEAAGQGATDRALALLDVGLVHVAQHPEHRAWGAYVAKTKAVILQGLDRWAEAADFHRSATKLTPLAQPWQDMARCQMHQNLWNEALNSLKEALRRNPYDYVSLGLAGQVCYQLENYNGAADFLSRAIKLVPDDHDSLLNLAITWARLGQIVRARQVLAVLLKYHPADPAGTALLQKLTN